MRAVDCILLKRDMAHEARVHNKLFTTSLLMDGNDKASDRLSMEKAVGQLGLNLDATEPIWIAEDLITEFDGRSTYSEPIQFGSESPWVSHGIVFLERPIVAIGVREIRPAPFTTDTSESIPISAFSWCQGLVPVMTVTGNPVMVPGVVVISWSSGADMVRWARSLAADGKQSPFIENTKEEPGFVMYPTGFSVLAFGGWFRPEENYVPGEYVYYDGDTAETAAPSTFAVLLHHLWKMLREDIVVHGREEGTRKHKKAMRRARLKETWVTTVHLRHVIYDSESDAEGRVVDWSHRWYVRGHKRRITDRKTGEVREIWVHAYIKGPPDKPLLMREHLYALDR